MMSDEMPSWRSLASSASKSIKGYVAQRDWKRPPSTVPRDLQQDVSQDVAARPSIRQWASQTIRAIAQPNGNGSVNIERLSLFPGWAHRRHHNVQDTDQASSPFDVEVYVSGFASQCSSVGFRSGRGKTLLYMAKYYAALPKLRLDDPAAMLPSEDIRASMHLPPKPEDMSDEAEMAELAAQMQSLAAESSSLSTNGTLDESSSSSSQSDSSSSPSSRSSPNLPPGSDYAELQRLHNNLETRLQPFVSSSLSNRPIRVCLYATDPQEMDFKSPPLGAALPEVDYALWRSPLVTETAVTAADGSFQLKIRVPWSKICAHPAAINIAYGNLDEHALYVEADLMPGLSRPPSPNNQVSYAVRTSRVSRHVAPTSTSYISIPISHSTIRLISDIDDTVKMSGILSGAKAVFHNVFVKDLADSIIPGMGEWYGNMWRQGVRFHYVSNSPFELLTVINQFISLSKLPPGSVKLKSYAGRSLFTDLLRAPAERKRAGIMDVLDSFPDARFFLVGDSGEQDLELYACIARERPLQILAVFIRDANNWDLVKPLDDPTAQEGFLPPGTGTIRRMSQAILTPGASGQTTPSIQGTIRRPRRSVTGDAETPAQVYAARNPKRTRSTAVPPVAYSQSSDNGTAGDYFTSPVTSSPESEYPGPQSYGQAGFTKSLPNMRRDGEDRLPSPTSSRSSGRTSSTASIRSMPAMTDAEKKQYDLQMRLYRARMEVPESIPVRVFRDPTECVEAKRILDELNIAMRSR